MFDIRKGTREEIAGFALYDESNEGENIIVAEQNGAVVAYAQMLDGETITFMESESKGAGRALVEYLKERGDHFIADSVDAVSAGFWLRMGFEDAGRKGAVRNYEWWAE